MTGPVCLRLHHEAKVYAACEFSPGEEWKKFSARLVPTARDVNATLSIEFRGPGTLWLDNASLMPLDTVGGWRPDVVAAVRALKPGIIRFGGSAVDAAGYGDFDWKKTIGDPDHRQPFRAWGGLQPTGPGLEEIVQFCRAVGAEPLICVRFNQRAPRDAAEEVEYFNGAVDTPMGALRAKNGHPQPYAVKYWQVGNEIQSAEYDARLADFCQAMKQADPAIKLLSSYATPASLKSAGPWLDYICPHHYGCGDLAAMENDFAHVRELLRENAPGRAVRIGVTEWNTTAGDAGTAAGHALDPGQCPGVLALSQPVAPGVRPRGNRQPLEPDQQLLLGHHPDRQSSPLQDAHLLRAATLCDVGRQPALAPRVRSAAQYGSRPQRNALG